jgi:hypothetical protein
MRGARELWAQSLLFRRLVTAAGLLVAAIVVYLASNIPRSVALPASELNEKCVARQGEDMLTIESPSVAAGDLVLSYDGGANQIADVRLDRATLAAASAKMFLVKGAPSGAAHISYTTGAPGSVSSTKAGDTCRTTIQIRLAEGSGALGALKLYQTEASAGQQLQLVLDAGATPLDVEVHTDAPPNGATNLPGCQKVLTVGDGAPLQLPLLPVWMVTAGGTITLNFNPANSAVSIVKGDKQPTFDDVSIGGNVIRAKELDVSPMHGKAPKPKLKVRAAPAGALLSIEQLQISSNKLRVEVGQDTEKAFAYENGASLYNYDLVAAIQQNAVLGIVLGIFGTGLAAWIKKNCFPGMGG